ncbi:MAG: type III toxin-antitoxin system ToxN/AbiQ family toxin, partial [Terracidiphilus sp.]
TSHTRTIPEKAGKLYELVAVKGNAFYSRTCCNFLLLEENYRNFPGCSASSVPAAALGPR